MSEELKNTRDHSAAEDHHDDFDGIRELNNPAPNWILLILLATIGFSLFYLVIYFGYPGNGNDQASEYKKKSEAFDKERQQQTPGAAQGTGMSQDDRIAAGAGLFLAKGCIACHGMKGEGNQVGPNLTDNYWLNGCTEENIVHMIAEGKPEKGMTPFKAMLTADEMKSLSTFILKKLVGSNPPNAKAPQGVECK